MSEEDYWSGPMAALQPLVPSVAITDKHMKRPPFKFLHDIFSAMHAVCPAAFPSVPAPSWDQSTIADKDAKIAFLDQILADVQRGLGKQCDVLTKKIVTGSECEKTCAFMMDVAAHFSLVSTCGGGGAAAAPPAAATGAGQISGANSDAGDAVPADKIKKEKRSKDKSEKSEKKSKRSADDKENDGPPPPPPPPPPTAPAAASSSSRSQQDGLPPPPPPPPPFAGSDSDTSRPPTAAAAAAAQYKVADPVKAGLVARAEDFRQKVAKYGMSLDSADLSPMAMAEAAIAIKREIDESRRDTTAPPKTGVQLSQEQLESQIQKQIDMIRQIDALVKGNAALVEDLILHAAPAF